MKIRLIQDFPKLNQANYVITKGWSNPLLKTPLRILGTTTMVYYYKYWQTTTKWHHSLFLYAIKIPKREILLPGCPLEVLFDHPGDLPIWRSEEVSIWRPGDILKWRPGDVLIWRSRGVPGRLIWGVPRTFSGRPLEDLQSTSYRRSGVIRWVQSSSVIISLLGVFRAQLNF